MLGASLAVRIHHPPIASLQELVQSDHEVLAMRGTSTYRYFQQAQEGSDQRRLFDSKMKDAESYLERTGLELIANGKESS